MRDIVSRIGAGLMDIVSRIGAGYIIVKLILVPGRRTRQSELTISDCRTAIENRKSKILNPPGPGYRLEKTISATLLRTGFAVPSSLGWTLLVRIITKVSLTGSQTIEVPV